MKKAAIFLMFMSSYLVQSSQQQPTQDFFVKDGALYRRVSIEEFGGKSGSPSVVVNTNNEVKGTFNQEATNGITSKQTQETDQNLKHDPTTDLHSSTVVPPTEKSRFEMQQEYCANKAGDFFDWIQNNKLKTSCAILLSGYSYTLYQIYAANQIIFDPASWSNWQGSRSLEDLFAVPQSKLESELLYLFQNRHIDLHNPTDFMYSLVQSSLSLQREIDVVRQQITRYEWIATCRCSRIFFIDAKSLEILKEKHKKLLFIKHIFASWCATYKIDKNL